MARGPAPARPDQKRRRNNDEEELPAEGYTGEYPPLPAKYSVRVWDGEKHKTSQVKFLASTRRWYEQWSTSPMAVEFTLVHWLRLQSIAKLQDRFDRGDLTVASELRQALAGFGGTPYDVRRLGRTITNPPTDASTPTTNPRRSDRRGRLEIVK